MHTEKPLFHPAIAHERLLCAAPEQDHQVTLIEPTHARRQQAEAFIQHVFHQAYAARLTSFYPDLLGITAPDGDYAAVAGVRGAGEQPLFAEHYLPQDIDRLIRIPRPNIVEIGNLAPASAGQARWLICTVTAFLSAAGFTHVVFTAVPKLYNAFRRMGLPLTILADACADKLPATHSDDWGRYYEAHPQVCCGEIAIGHAALAPLVARDPMLANVWQQATQAGHAYANHGGAIQA